MIDEAIDELREEYSKEVFAVCTDNENKMKKMKDLVSNKYPDMLCYGCSAHYANLLEKDVSLPAVTKHVVEVNKYFRNVHVAHGLLKEKGGRMPQIPNDTRWNSEVDCLESFKDNHNIFMEIRAELMDDMPNNIGRILDNIGIYREASRLLDDLKKFGVALDKLQSDTCHLSEAVDIWLSLIRDPELRQYREAVEKRFLGAIQPFHIVAFLTDHRYGARQIEVLAGPKGQLFI